jgi:hypothetical protein
VCVRILLPHQDGMIFGENLCGPASYDERRDNLHELMLGVIGNRGDSTNWRKTARNSTQSFQISISLTPLREPAW